MSLSPNSPDLLTFSPSLPNVLHLLSYDDVLNCRLVNRRFYQLIQRHCHSLLTCEQVISVYPKMDESGSKELCMVVVVSYNLFCDHDVYIYITEERLRMKYTLEFLPVVKYFKDNGIPSQDNTDYHYENGLNDAWKSQYEYELAREKVNILTVDYKITDIQETMRELLGFLLINFYTERLSTFDDTPAGRKYHKTKVDYKKIIADMLTENRKRCKHFEVVASPGVEEYVDKIKRSILGFLRTVLPRINQFDLIVDYADYGQQLLDVIRAWERCDLTIVRFFICGNTLKWSFQEIETAVTGSFRLTFLRSYRDEDETLEVFIRRPVDDAVVCLRFSRNVDIQNITKLNPLQLPRPLEIPLHQIGLL